MSFSRCARWLAAALLLVTAAGGDERAPAPQRIFQFDLYSLGAPDLEAPGSSNTQLSLPASVGFVNNSSLAVSFPAPNSRTVLSRRANPQGGSYVFRIAMIDLQSGRGEVLTSSATAQAPDRALTLPGGRLLLNLGNKVVLLAADGREERAYTLRQTRPARPVRLLTSPSLRTLFLVTPAGEHQERVEVLATDTLTQLHAFTIESMGFDAASDSYFAYLLPGKNGFALFELAMRDLGSGPVPPLTPLYFTHGDGCILPKFVADDLLLLTGLCDSLTLIAHDGSVRAQQRLPFICFLTEASPSADQGRFALAFVRTMLEEPIPVRVYDTHQLTVVSDLELRRRSDEWVPQVRYALSADGSLLAVIHGFNLSVYQLPPPAPGEVRLEAGMQASRPPFALSTQPAPAQPGPPTPASAAEAAYGPHVEVQRAAGLEVAVSLGDLRQDAIRAMVRISNHGTTETALAPERATLEILNPAAKTLRSMNPDKLATGIQRVGTDDAEHARYGCEPGESSAVSGVCDKVLADAFEMERSAELTAADVRAFGLRAQTLKPGSQVTGAIFFTYQKRRGESVLRLPIGDQVFEFRFPPQEPEKK